MRAMDARGWLTMVSMAAGLGMVPAACSLVNKPSDPVVAECLVPKDCGESTECEAFTCNAGICEKDDAKAGTECKGGVCDGKGKCTPASCADLTKNGDESDVDCGGSCPACANDKACAKADDCASRHCGPSAKCAACSDDTDCAGAPDTYCFSAVCTPKKKNGEACAVVSECLSGVCAEGVCCNSDCASGACGSCKVQGKEGTCTPVAAAAAPLQGATCGAGLTCDGVHNSCQKCTKDSECGTGHCADGFCCNTACTGGCERCDVPGSEGTCKPALAGTVGKGCGNYLCNGNATTCIATCVNAASCVPDLACQGLSQQCVTPIASGSCSLFGTPCESGVCQATPPVITGTCLSPSCSDSHRDLYETDVDCGGNTCAKCANGKQCERNADCSSGFCSEGVCCNSACDGPCNTCSSGTCLVTPNASCSDGWACTAPGTCNVSVCQNPKPSGGAVVYLDEDFSDNLAGWQLDTDWQIGPADESPTFSTSIGTENYVLVGDPSRDHTNSNDNRLAGVLIGGVVNNLTVHDFYWLTSPAMDTSHAPTLTLEFWRWLTTLASPKMVSRVEAFDGQAWQVVWEQPANAVLFDRAWTYQAIDLSKFANKNMRVRFGYAVEQAQKGQIGQWNVDDVRIATDPCGVGY